MKHFKYIACHTILFFHFAILILFILLNEAALETTANLSSPWQWWAPDGDAENVRTLSDSLLNKSDYSLLKSYLVPVILPISFKMKNLYL